MVGCESDTSHNDQPETLRGIIRYRLGKNQPLPDFLPLSGRNLTIQILI